MSRNHSSLVGGSTAARVLACPGSVVANLNLPPQITVPSEYAEEGTFYHAAIADILSVRQDYPDIRLEEYMHEWIGEKFHDRILTQQHVDEAITPALAELEALENAYGGGFEIVAIERRVKFPGLTDVYGTIDLMLRNDRVMLHIDFKFGQGVPVSAQYDDQINPQLMFYICAARHTIRPLYGTRSDVAAIIQPRSEIKLSHAPVTAADRLEFKAKLKFAVIDALRPQAPRHKGEHCRWAACKPTCPLWTGPLLDAAVMRMPVVIASEDPDAYGKHLAKAKQLVDIVSVMKTEVDLQLHTYLANGGKVPGWRLKLKQKNRQWIDEAKVDKELRKLGMKPSEIWRRKLLTFEAADSWARRKHKTIPDHLRVAPPSNETTICAENDPAPKVEATTAIEQFRASLRQLVAPNANPA